MEVKWTPLCFALFGIEDMAPCCTYSLYRGISVGSGLVDGILGLGLCKLFLEPLVTLDRLPCQRFSHDLFRRIELRGVGRPGERGLVRSASRRSCSARCSAA